MRCLVNGIAVNADIQEIFTLNDDKCSKLY